MKKKTKTVVAVLVNWNGKTDTLACIRSLESLVTRLFRFVLIVVDNGSSDDSVSQIRKKFPAATLIVNATNTGYTGGNNAGMQRAMEMGADYIWLLNNDTTVDPGAAHELFLASEGDPRIGVAGSKIYFSPGREFHVDRYTEKDRGSVIWYAGGRIDWNNMYISHRGVDEVDHGQFDHREETEFITGCSMFLRRRVIESVGFLDERYFAYLEDFDYCQRIRARGFTLMYVPNSVIWHNNAGSTARPGNAFHQYYFTRNRLLAGFRWAPLRTKLALVRQAVSHVWGKGPATQKGVIDFFLGRFGNRYIWKT